MFYCTIFEKEDEPGKLGHSLHPVLDRRKKAWLYVRKMTKSFARSIQYVNLAMDPAMPAMHTCNIRTSSCIITYGSLSAAARISRRGSVLNVGIGEAKTVQKSN